MWPQILISFIFLKNIISSDHSRRINKQAAGDHNMIPLLVVASGAEGFIS